MSLYHKKQWQRAYFQCRIAKEATTNMFLMLRAAVVLPESVWWQWFKHCKTRGCNNQFLYAVDQRMTAISAVDRVDNGNKHTLVRCIAKSGDNNCWLQQGSARLRPATTNKIFMTHQGSKQRSRNDYIVNAIIMSYVEWQEALMMAATVDCNERFQNRTTTTNRPLMWMKHINDRKGARHQRWDWSWCHDDNGDDATIISRLYC